MRTEAAVTNRRRSALVRLFLRLAMTLSFLGGDDPQGTRELQGQVQDALAHRPYKDLR